MFLRQLIDPDEALARDGFFDRTDFAAADTGKVLCFAANRTYLKQALSNPRVSAIVTKPELADIVPEPIGLLLHPDPEMKFYKLHNALVLEHGMRVQHAPREGRDVQIHSTAIIEPGSRIGDRVEIGAYAIISSGTEIGNDVRIGAGAQVGCVGHFYKRRPGELLCVEHAGGVRLADGAQILPGATVQRALHMTDTVIGLRSVIGPNVNIGHGCRIGDEVTIAGNAVVAGYTVVGDRVWIGPGAVLANLMTIGDDARIEFGAVIARSVSAGQHMSGFYARPHRTALRMAAGLEREYG